MYLLTFWTALFIQAKEADKETVNISFELTTVSS